MGLCAGYTATPDVVEESIDAWKECVAVPVGEIAFMRDVFMGAELRWNQYAATQRIAAYLPRVVVDESE